MFRDKKALKNKFEMLRSGRSSSKESPKEEPELFLASIQSTMKNRQEQIVIPTSHTSSYIIPKLNKA
jgi:hypothetical protein